MVINQIKPRRNLVTANMHQHSTTPAQGDNMLQTTQIIRSLVERLDSMNQCRAQEETEVRTCRTCRELI